MKLLVVGGAGYVGSCLVPRLLEREYEVDVVDKLWFGNHLPDAVDVRDTNLFDLSEEDLAGYDQVIFLAGLSNDPMAEYSPGENFVSNAAAPAYLGYIAKRAGVARFIFASSCSVYGYTVNELYDETGPASSSYPYGIAKLQGEQSLLQLQDKQFSVISLRKGTICGYSPRMRLDLIINAMFASALGDGLIQVNNPTIWRPILGVRDAVSAYVRAIECNLAISGVFNIAYANYTVGEVADIVRETLENRLGIDIRLKVLSKQDYRNYKVCTDKATNVLSFRPRHDVDSIVRELITHRDEFSDFGNPRYHNIEVFKALPSHGWR